MNKQVCLNSDGDKRDKYIDIIRGVAIFLVIWGHSIQYSTADMFDFFNDDTFKIIYSFHMPLFMIISGYLFYFSFKKRSWIDLMKNKIKTILKTIVIWNIISYITSKIIEYVLEDKFTFSVIEMIKSVRGLWFLWAVLACSIIVGTIGRCKSGVLEIILLICVIPTIKVFPNNILIIFVYPYFVLGYLFNKYRKLISDKVKKVRFLALLTFPIMCLFYEKKDYIYVSGINIFNSKYGLWDQIGIDIFRWAIGLIGSICVMVILELIVNYKEIGIINVFYKLGSISLQIYVIQNILLENVYSKFYKVLCNNIGKNILLENMIVYDFIITILVASIFLIIIYYIIRLVQKKHIVNSVLFGR